MSQITKVRITATGEEIVFGHYPDRYTLLSTVQEMTDNDELTEADYQVLPESDITKDEWLEFVGEELTDNNYHPERRIVINAVGFMSDDKAVEYLKQVGSVMP